MRLILNYYDPDDGEVIEEIELMLNNDKFDQGVANKFITDFDRCEHGRHATDVCSDCDKSYGGELSRGNPSNHDEKWYDNQGNRIYAFALGGAAGWVVVDGVLGLSSDL